MSGDGARCAVAEISDFSRHFPSLPDRAIDRDHVIDTLAQVPSGDTPVVFLEGLEGLGATTLLAQFYQKHPKTTFTLFVKPASRFAYNPDYLRLILSEQFWFLLHGKKLEQDFVDVSQFASLLLQVRKRNRAATMYVLVDGVHQIPKDDQRIAEIFSDVLPLGVDGFRFIITGSQDVLGKHLGKVRSKTYQLLRFSDAESHYFLGDLEISADVRDQLAKLCRGIPGRLGSVRRLIQSNVSAETILRSEPDKYLEFINLEFAPIDKLTEPQRTLLSILAFSRHDLSASDLLQIFPESGLEDVTEICNQCVFLEKDGTSHLIDFRSQAHRRFAENTLRNYKQRALSLQVDNLIKNPNSAAALRLLPTYYQSLNQQQSIIDLLSKEHYTQLLEVTHSISALKTRAAIGAKSAMELNQATEVFQFALHRGIFSAVGDIEELTSEVSALVGLGQTQKALDIAAQSVATEKRLFLLAEFARRTKELGSPVDPQIVAYIRELVAQIDFQELGDAAVQLAENLLFVDPDLALSIVDMALKAENDSEKRDAAYVKLSLAVTMSDSEDKDELEEKSRSKISNESLQKLLGSLNSIVADFSYEEIVGTAEQMQITRRIYFLRSLVAVSRSRARVLDVVEYALDQLVADTSYSPKAKDLADLACPLALVTNDEVRIRHLVKRLESQIGLIKKGAPSGDLVLLEMRLAHAEMSFDVAKAQSRIAEVYYDIASMENAEVQTLCFATMSQALNTIDTDGALEASDGFRAVILDDLRRCSEALLTDTASHYQILAPVLKALAQENPEEAVAFVSKINTQERRDRAYKEVARSIVRCVHAEDSARQLAKALSCMHDSDSRNDAILGVIQTIALSNHVAEWFGEIPKLLSRLDDPFAICTGVTDAVRLATRTARTDGIATLLSRFDAAIDDIDSLPSRIDFYFELSAALAAFDNARALALYEKGVELRQSTALSSQSAATTLKLCLALILRVFRGQMKTHDLVDEHIERFTKLCELLPCAISRASLYGDLACKAWCEDRADLCKEIVSKRCRPLLESCEHTNVSLHSELCNILFPALYCAHRGTALAAFEKTAIGARPRLVYATALMILRKTAPSEPWNSVEDDRVKVTHEDLTDISDILALSPNDASFYSVLQSTTTAASRKENRSKLSGQQRADFANKITALIATKLPDQNNILHNGYVVISQAQLLRLSDGKTYEPWRRLVDEAETIPNLADKSYVILEIAKCLPTRFLTEKKALLSKAREYIREIPAVGDRYSRLEAYIRTARRIAPAEAKAALKDALLLTFDSSQRTGGAQYRRNLVDIAETMESSLLDELAEMIDDDPARAEAKAEMNRSVEVHKLKNKMSSTDSNIDPAQLTVGSLPSAAWKNVSALVSGRLETRTPQMLSAYVDAAGGFSLRDAYPVLSWYVENCTRRFISSQDVNQRTQPLSEVLLLSTEIAASVISLAPIKQPSLLEAFGGGDSTPGSSHIVRPGERFSALEFIRQWMRTVGRGPLVLCDPYFGPEDYDFLRLVLSEIPDSKVRIITSRKAVLAAGRDFSAEVFLREWNEAMDQDPPETEILSITSMGGGPEILVHDRWILAPSSGLRLGTSFNSLGGDKLSEISPISVDEAVSIGVELDRYFRRDRLVNGIRVSYMSVSF